MYYLSNILGIKEDFNGIFKPNKIYRYDNKIFVLDSNHILEKNKNPLVFDNFSEYKKYVISLEDKFKEKINFYINNKNTNIKNIKNIEDIKNINSNVSIKDYSIKNQYPFYKKYNCNRKQALCDMNETKPFFESIFDPKILNKFQKEECDKLKLNNDICNKFKDIKDNKKIEELNNKCFNNKNFDKECKFHLLYQYNKDKIDEVCGIKNNRERNFEKKCMLEDFFRENMLEFEI